VAGRLVASIVRSMEGSARAVDAALTYIVVTPARNEADNLRRLAGALEMQTLAPTTWIVVDDRSTDDTVAVVRELQRSRPWIVLTSRPSDPGPEGRGRGASVVPSIHAGIDAIPKPPAVVAKVDADISFEADYFERLLAVFEEDPSIGIASGTCLEVDEGEWRPRFQTGGMIWGAARGYRWDCLQDVLPLEQRMGWDGLDVAKANALGWTTTALLDLPFYHHRAEASRERTRWHAWAVQGEACHYMGYRPTYLLARTLHTMRRDPAALAMLWTYMTSKVRRAPTTPDAGVRSIVRESQRLRALPARRREARGDRAA
jgi:hypothetical protein